jgi:hypothetical protein
MSTLSNRNSRKRGTALFTVMIITFTVSALLVTVVGASMQRSYVARKLADRVRALAIAEAGVSSAYNILAKDWDARTNAAAFPETAYGDGTYDVNIRTADALSASIVSTGTYRGTVESVILDVMLTGVATPGYIPPLSPVFDHVIVSEGEISWTGSGQFIGGGTVHANAAFKQAGAGELNADVTSSKDLVLKGDSGFIDGNVSAPQVRGKTDKITGSITEAPVPAVQFPKIDLTPYYNYALAHGEVYSGKVNLNHAYTPNGGIMWIDGDLAVGGTELIEGCFIATGDISLAGAGQHKVQGFPAFISRDGNIKISGGGSYQGLIYAPVGGIEIVGGGEITGTILSGSDFKKSGSSTIFNYQNSVPVAPNSEPTPIVLAVTAWQK